MSGPPPVLDQRLYFGGLSVLALESSLLELDLLAQVLTGFKIRTLARFTQAEAAWTHLEHEPADLLFVGSSAGPTDEFDFIRKLRRAKDVAMRTAPAILLTGHTQRANVLRARDCGASFVVAKPILPKVLYSRIVWLAKDRRNFIDVESYCGPDRRFHNLGPPAGMEGRRKDDLSLRVGAAVEDNMSQDEIDALMNPKSAAQ
jgi:DNA-binding response OmpR family regulator